MRHIYNAESPPSIVDGASLDSGNHETSANSGGGSNSQLLQCITDCANASRLSLINLLPSRFGITKYFQCFSFFLFRRCYLNHFSRTIDKLALLVGIVQIPKMFTVNFTKLIPRPRFLQFTKNQIYYSILFVLKIKTKNHFIDQNGRSFEIFI